MQKDYCSLKCSA